MKWMCDFETTTDVNDCRVWLWGAKAIGDNLFLYGTTIKEFITWCSNHCGDTIYFHNAKFDTEFIFAYLLSNGWKHIIKDAQRSKKTFSTLISDQGIFYSCRIYFTKYDYVTINDSFKILPFKVKKIAQDFGLPMGKGEIDYEKPRELDYKPDENEVEYLYRDCEIVATVLNQIFTLGLTKMTQGSDALHDFTSTIGGGKTFKRYFPDTKL